MSGFTKGPWQFIDATKVAGMHFKPLCVIKAGDKQVASFSWNDNSKWFPTKDESQANARLIAAAPELYEECRALYAVMFHQQCPKCGIAWSEDECQEMGARRKAICLCGYEQAIDGTALSKASGEGR